METLPFSRLPGMNALFLDFVDAHEKVQDLYPSSSVIRNPDLPHRAALCSILQRQNASFANPATGALVEKLSKDATHCVITGQQVGLLSGPLYTLWKAFTVLKLCKKWEQQGLSCVPIFWMASEDHNWHEVMNLALLKEDFSLLEFSLKEHFFLQRRPTGGIPTSHPEARKILLRCFHEMNLPMVREFYSEGTLAQAFARTLLWLMRDYPILIVDPSDPELKQLAAPFFKRFFERSDSLMTQLDQQNRDLEKRNYPVQVKMEEGALPLFKVNGDERKHVPRGASTDTLPPETLSPSALLRPLFQDYLFPTLAYIGGPAEIAYFGQLHPWYATMEIEQPRLIPRASLTLLPSATVNFLKSKNLNPEDLYTREDILFDALLRDRDLESARKEIHELGSVVKERFTRIQEGAGKIEGTLKKAVQTSGRKIEYQLEKLERKALIAARRKDVLLSEQIRKAKHVLYPGDKLQERHLNVFSFASRLPELIHEVYEKIDVEVRSHQWIKI